MYRPSSATAIRCEITYPESRTAVRCFVKRNRKASLMCGSPTHGDPARRQRSTTYFSYKSSKAFEPALVLSRFRGPPSNIRTERDHRLKILIYEGTPMNYNARALNTNNFGAFANDRRKTKLRMRPRVVREPSHNGVARAIGLRLHGSRRTD